jgi:hypothetical protein
MTQQNALEQVRAALAANGADFVLLSNLPDTRAHVRFLGRFEGRAVLWDMQLYTLERYEQERGKVGDSALRGLMQIAPVSENVYQLEVALNVPLLDEPALKKTIVMMRNYRQLHLGLRTWADQNQLGSESN